jgi:hypothetical protein
MGRQVAIRASYDNDARYMLRLKEAVEKDKRDPEFVKEASSLLQNLAKLLIVGPNIPEEKKKSSKR